MFTNLLNALQTSDSACVKMLNLLLFSIVVIFLIIISCHFLKILAPNIVFIMHIIANNLSVNANKVADVQFAVVANVIQMLRKKTPEGVKVIEILKEYKQQYGVYLDITGMGFKSIFEFCERVCERCVHCVTICDKSAQFRSERMFFDERRYKAWTDTHKKDCNVVFLEQLAAPLIADDVALVSDCKDLPQLQVPLECSLMYTEGLDCVSYKVRQFKYNLISI